MNDNTQDANVLDIPQQFKRPADEATKVFVQTEEDQGKDVEVILG